jgi:hypothetical protein
MRKWKGRVVPAVLLLAGSMAVADDGQEERSGPKCWSVRADLVEDFSTVGCAPPSTSCFLGEVDGNRGLRGTTRFDGDSGAAGPSTSPGFISYSGIFEYFTERGTLIARETGVVNTTTGNPESGAVTAYQKIIDANGELTGATGFFFVSGFSINSHLDTKVTGRICLP